MTHGGSRQNVIPAKAGTQDYRKVPLPLGSREGECNPIQSWRPDSFGSQNDSQDQSSDAVCGRACDQQTSATPPKVPFSECANGDGQLDYSPGSGNPYVD